MSYASRFRFLRSVLTVGLITVGTAHAQVVDVAVAISGPGVVIGGSGEGNLTYVVTVTNNGPSDATGVELEVSLPLDDPPGCVAMATVCSITPTKGTFSFAESGPSFSVGTWILGDLAHGDDETLIAVLSVGPSLSFSELLASALTTAVNEFDDDPNNDGDLDLTFVLPPPTGVDVAVVTSDSIDPVIAGSGAGNLTYTFTGTNYGPSNATGVELEFNLPREGGVTVDSITPSAGTFEPCPGPLCFTWTLGDLAAFSSETLAAVLTVDSSIDAVIDAFAFVTMVNETDANCLNDDDIELTTVIPESTAVDVMVGISESIDPVIAGSGAGNLTYVVTATNNGPSAATGVELSEVLTLPAGVTVDSITPSAGTFAGTTWALSDLANGASETLTVVITIAASTVPGPDVISDTAAVTMVNETDTDPANDSVTVSTSVVREVDLAVGKSESVDPVVAGSGAGNLTYVVTVENLGPSEASGVTLSKALTLPAGVTADSITPSGVGVFTPPSTWTVGNLPLGAGETLTMVLTAGSSAAPGTDVIADTTAVEAANETLIDTGDDAATESTSIVAEADLAIDKDDSQDPAAAGDPLTYHLTVTNLGPSDSAGGTITDRLPAALAFDSSADGCTVNGQTVTCPAPAVPVGASDTVTFVVIVSPTAPATVANTASVAGEAPDPQAANDSDTEETAIDSEPPTVTTAQATCVGDEATVGLAEIMECSQLRLKITELRLVFSEPVRDPAGNAEPDDVTNPANYRLLASGPDRDFATAACDPVAGDDQEVTIDGIAYDAGTSTATLSVNGGAALADSLYRLLACGSTTIRDLPGNALDGDGDGVRGDDFVRTFRVETANLLDNGFFDCGLEPWILLTTIPEEIEYSTDDADGSEVSGSAQIVNLAASTELALSQCVSMEPGLAHVMRGEIRLNVVSGDTVPLGLVCDFFSEPDCAGASDSKAVFRRVLDEPGPEWITLEEEFVAPADAASAACSIVGAARVGAFFDINADNLGVLPKRVIFADGFESGDASGWLASVGLK